MWQLALMMMNLTQKAWSSFFDKTKYLAIVVFNSEDKPNGLFDWNGIRFSYLACLEKICTIGQTIDTAMSHFCDVKNTELARYSMKFT